MRSGSAEMRIRRLRLNSKILHSTSSREAVDRREVARLELQRVRDQIVEETTDAGAAEARRGRRFGFEVEDVTDRAGFEVQAPIEPSAVQGEASHVPEHRDGEGALGGDRLSAADETGDL